MTRFPETGSLPEAPLPSFVFQGPAPIPRDDARALRATVDLAPIGIAHLQRDGRLLLVNRRLCAILDYPEHDLLARSVQEITFPADLQRSLDLLAEVAANGSPGGAAECRLVRRDGSTIWVRLTMSAVRGPGDRPEVLVGIVEDISGQRENEEARRAAEERLRVALAASATGTFRWDARSELFEFDENLAPLFGLPPGVPHASAAFRARVHPDDLPRLSEAWSRCFTHGEELDEEFRVVWPDGSVHWLRDRGRAIADEAGVPSCLAGATTDVTYHRRIEDELRAQEERFRALANTIPQLAWMTDATGAIDWYNQRWYDYTGTTLAEVQGWGWRCVHHPDHVDRVVARIRHSFESGEPWEDTFPLRGADGRYRWFLSRALPIRDRDGRIVSWFGTNTDITDRLEAEEAVRASEAKLRRIAESGLIGIFYWTRAGAITEANDAFCRMLGFTRDEVEAGALDWRRLTPPEWGAVGRAKEAELAAHGVVTPWEKEFYARDGRRVPVLVGSALLEGHADRGVAVCLDISARKEAELERERLLAREQSARAEAEHASRLRDEVLGIVAHDLRNPVHMIMMSASTMLEVALPEEQRARYLASIQRAAARMTHLISDLLDVTRIESGSFAIHRAPVHVGTLVDEMLEHFGPQAEARDIDLAGRTEADLPPVMGDHARLVQVLSNLLDNALKFTPAGGRIAVEARRVEGAVHVAVSDSGCGIPAESLPHVFDRFWQADSASRAGAGLGLAIAHGIVAAHGGRMRVESTVGRGTTFHLTLPAGAP